MKDNKRLQISFRKKEDKEKFSKIALRKGLSPNQFVVFLAYEELSKV